MDCIAQIHLESEAAKLRLFLVAPIEPLLRMDYDPVLSLVVTETHKYSVGHHLAAWTRTMGSLIGPR